MFPLNHAERKPARMSPGPAIYLGGFERKSSPVILLGPPDSPRCALGASHTDDHGAPAKPKTTSARSSPPKTRVLHSLVLGQPRHMLFQHQQQTLGEQVRRMNEGSQIQRTIVVSESHVVH
uniref:Uncharacterized protein n=1 Tax=Dunaliella tertiolecta TaxID=3047 RepID=A0A7S3QZU1_DUNTE